MSPRPVGHRSQTSAWRPTTSGPLMFRPLYVSALPALALAALLFPRSAHAEEAAGVSATRLKLPSGPGSLEGVGENAEANLNMGLVTYGVPFSLPAGYQGFSPSLGLSYNSAGGASVTGIGWEVGVPS